MAGAPKHMATMCHTQMDQTQANFGTSVNVRFEPEADSFQVRTRGNAANDGFEPKADKRRQLLKPFRTPN